MGGSADNIVVYVSNAGKTDNNSVRIVSPEEFNAIRSPVPWPTQPHRDAERCCDHCCHPFDTQAVPVATHYDAKLDVFTVHGYFCSFACGKAHLLQTSTNPTHATVNTLFRKRCVGGIKPCLPAPPRCCLKKFGGTMSIEEFRAASDNACYVTLPPKMVTHHIVVEQRLSNTARQEEIRLRKTVEKSREEISFREAATGSTDPIKLRKPRKNGPVAIRAPAPPVGGMDAFLI